MRKGIRVTKSKIHYMNAYPGMGKTHYAITKMFELLTSKKKRASIIYCAPTFALLEEVMADLRSRIATSDLDLLNKVHLFKSNSYSHGGRSVVNRIMHHLDTKEHQTNSIVLMTHEAFSRLSLLDSFRYYRVYFDEARKIVIEGTLLPVHSKTDFKILKRALKPCDTADGYHLLDPIRLEAALQKVKTQMTRRSMTSFYHMLDKARSQRLEVYISLKEGSTSSRSSFQAYEIVMPSKLFLQFKYVMLMASHFNESQMYWVLKTDKHIKMIDSSHLLTESKAGSERYTRVKWRYRKVKILPLTANPSPMSKAFIYGDLLVGENAALVLSESGMLSRNVNLVRALLTDTGGEEPTKKELKIRNEVRHEIVSDPLTFLLRRAKEVCTYIMDQQDYVEKPLLVINNGMEQQIYNSGGRDFWDKLPFTSHGLNGYASKNVIVFLAAVQISFGLKAFLKARIPRYDPNLDHVADVCNQAVCRTCVRNPSSQAEVYALVPDMKIAQMLKDKMMGEPTISEGLLRKSPTRMVSLSTVHRLVKQASVTERVEKKAEANALKLAEKQKVRKAYLEHLYVTPTYRAYASATASLYRAKKENHPKLAAYEKKHAEAKATAAELRKQLRAKLGL